MSAQRRWRFGGTRRSAKKKGKTEKQRKHAKGPLPWPLRPLFPPLCNFRGFARCFCLKFAPTHLTVAAQKTTEEPQCLVILIPSGKVQGPLSGITAKMRDERLYGTCRPFCQTGSYLLVFSLFGSARRKSTDLNRHLSIYLAQHDTTHTHTHTYTQK